MTIIKSISALLLYGHLV